MLRKNQNRIEKDDRTSKSEQNFSTFRFENEWNVKWSKFLSERHFPVFSSQGTFLQLTQFENFQSNISFKRLDGWGHRICQIVWIPRRKECWCLKTITLFETIWRWMWFEIRNFNYHSYKHNTLMQINWQALGISVCFHYEFLIIWCIHA